MFLFCSEVGWDKLASSAGPLALRGWFGLLFWLWWAGAAKRRWSHPTSRGAQSCRPWHTTRGQLIPANPLASGADGGRGAFGSDLVVFGAAIGGSDREADGGAADGDGLGDSEQN